MVSKRYKAYTVYLDEGIVETAKYKSNGNISSLMRNLLCEYVSTDGNIDELERKNKELDKLIKEYKVEKASNERRIKELEEQKERNAKNKVIMNHCYDVIKGRIDKKGFITYKTLKGIATANGVNVSVLNDLCNEHDFRIEWINALAKDNVKK